MFQQKTSKTLCRQISVMPLVSEAKMHLMVGEMFHIHFDTRHLTGVLLPNSNLDMIFLPTPGFLSGLVFFLDKRIFGGMLHVQPPSTITSKGVAIMA